MNVYLLTLKVIVDVKSDKIILDDMTRDLTVHNPFSLFFQNFNGDRGVKDVLKKQAHL